MTKDAGGRSRPTEIYQLKIAVSVQGDLDQLPQRSAAAAMRLMMGDLRQYPERIGLKLSGALAGKLSAPGAGFRILYRVDRAELTVHILQIIPKST